MGKNLKGKELGQYLSQRKDGTYLARFTNRFGKRVCLYDDDLKILKVRLNEELYNDKQKLNLCDENLTLDEWYNKWLSIHKFKVIRANTKRHYENVYKKHISPTLGKYKLVDITQLKIREVLKDLAKKGYKSETQNKVKIMLIDMYDKAILDNFAKKNPAKGIKIIRDDIKDIKALSVEEQQIFFECCKGTFYDNLFTVAVSTGLRPGELCALTWNDIDLNNKEISVTKTLLYQKLEGDDKKTFHFELPKTQKSTRKVPINRQCEIALKKQRMQEIIVKSKTSKELDKNFSNLLFTTKFGTPINAQIYSDAIRRIIDEINLTKDTLDEFEYFSGHCFRHTFATRCFEAGIPAKTVQDYLGHASLKMTMDLYTHLFSDQKHDDMKKLEIGLDKLLDINDKIIDEKFNEFSTKDNIVHLTKII